MAQKNVLQSLEQALQNIDIAVEKTMFDVPFRGGQLDCLLEISSSFGQRRLAIKRLGHAYPRDIRNAAWQLESFRKGNDSAADIILMVVAEHLSHGAKDDLRHHGLAYFEAGGTFYLRHDQWLIDIQQPSRPSLPRSAVQLFTGAREQVVLTLLMQRHQFKSGLELAELSQTSTYTVSIVLAELERREWIENEGSGRTLRRRLSNPSALLDAWGDAWVQRKETKTKWYCYVSNPTHILDHVSAKIMHSSIANAGVFTGAAAANRITPNLTRTDTIDLIIPEGKSALYASELGMEPVDKGSNVTLIERTGASTMFTNKDRKLNEPHLANPFILYLDLLDGKGRNKELAEQLRLNELGI